jgi:hypothetical protein
MQATLSMMATMIAIILIHAIEGQQAALRYAQP